MLKLLINRTGDRVAPHHGRREDGRSQLLPHCLTTDTIGSWDVDFSVFSMIKNEVLATLVCHELNLIKKKIVILSRGVWSAFVISITSHPDVWFSPWQCSILDDWIWYQPTVKRSMQWIDTDHSFWPTIIYEPGIGYDFLTRYNPKKTKSIRKRPNLTHSIRIHGPTRPKPDTTGRVKRPNQQSSSVRFPLFPRHRGRFLRRGGLETCDQDELHARSCLW